ncbi:Aromatic/aminoadipate aminotransferase 1 [Pestalotiopsis sp. 9143b]|nr:Aromatic/aminoadipate aminotransferase 1 [Pestalotiopsis sp. 9143b]
MSISAKVDRYRKDRAKSDPLPTGSAPFTSSLFFKKPQTTRKPKAKQWDHILSLNSSFQMVSPLKTASRGKPMISLGTARPTPQYYPWKAMSLECINTATQEFGKHHKLTSMRCSSGEAGYDLAVAMNYGYSAGSPQALRFVTEHVEMIHDPQYDDWECCLTCGTTSALEIALRIMCNIGDTVLTEKYTYSEAIAAIGGQGLRTQGVEMDELGLLPDDLDKKLQDWDLSDGRGPKPSVLYMIPTGQNPTGTTQPLGRRMEIYQIAVKHGLLILEDDPYYFLQMRQAPPRTVGDGDKHEDRDAYVEGLPRSYLSLDTDGRVLRMDTASKILAPGLRCGWVTGCSQIIEKFIAFSEVGVLSPSGPSQVMVFKLLDETWGHLGVIDWLQSLSRGYLCRREILLQACRDHLPVGVCSWSVPDAGMFVWMRMEVSKHPSYDERSCDLENTCREIEDGIYSKSQENGVLVSKGSWFLQGGPLDEVSFRLTFAAAPEAELVQAVIGFADAVCSEYNLDTHRE